MWVSERMRAVLVLLTLCIIAQVQYCGADEPAEVVGDKDAKPSVAGNGDPSSEIAEYVSGFTLIQLSKNFSRLCKENP